MALRSSSPVKQQASAPIIPLKATFTPVEEIWGRMRCRHSLASRIESVTLSPELRSVIWTFSIRVCGIGFRFE